ncbi:MAG: hypothetical protein ABIN00_07945 [candidate division WOR-3 bacterium]
MKNKIEFNDFEKYILFRSGEKSLFDKKKEKIYLKNLNNLLENILIEQIPPEIFPQEVYLLYNPILKSIPEKLVYVKEILDDDVIVIPEYEGKTELCYDSPKLNRRICFAPVQISLPKEAFVFSKYIEDTNLKDLNLNIILNDVFKIINEDEFKYISPYIHLKAYIEEYKKDRIFVWEIPVDFLKPVLVAKKKQPEMDQIINNIEKLQKMREIKFKDGNILFLKFQDKKIVCKSIEGKFLINNKKVEDKELVLTPSFERESIIKVKSLKSGEMIEIRFKIV